MCNDDTLSLEVRNGYVDIYYRGSRLLGLHERGEGAWFHAEFDTEYLGKPGEYRIEPEPELPERRIAERSDAAAWVDAFALCKQAMDIRFCLNAKLEREYQQALERDNNRHVSGDESDYAIIDIEYAQSALAIPGRKTDFRFDMVGVRWPAKPRKRTSSAIPVLMEMKVGDGSLTSERSSKTGKMAAGLIKHVKDVEEFLRPELDGTPSLPLAQLRRRGPQRARSGGGVESARGPHRCQGRSGRGRSRPCGRCRPQGRPRRLRGRSHGRSPCLS